MRCILLLLAFFTFDVVYTEQLPAQEDFTVAAYYYPCTHPHPRWDKAKYPGFTEWDLIRKAKPRFPGHKQPKVPVWGYQDESDPVVMAQKIDAAAEYGIDAFIFDWYYYDDGPYLERALDNGFLKAKNNDRIKFAIMYANHDWYDIQGYNPADQIKLLYPGRIKPQTWETVTDLVIKRYFKHPSYWKIDGKPYFSIYEIQLFLESFGSVEAAGKALDEFRQKAVQAGLPGIHINAILWGSPNLPGGNTPTDWPNLCNELNLDSLTGYTWVHHGALNNGTFPVSGYKWGRDRYLNFLDESINRYPVPYFPNTTINWDNSPRAHPDADWSRPAAHVVNPVMQGNTPAAFKHATQLIVQRLMNSKASPKILTVNAWNEWPEGSCLEPEQEYGYGYLEVIRELKKPTILTVLPDEYIVGYRVPIDTILSWQELIPGTLKSPVFNVYLSTDKEKVTALSESVLVSAKQSSFTFSPELQPGTLYYWAVSAYVDRLADEPLIVTETHSFKTAYEDEHWSCDLWDNDSNSDISINKFYTHKVNFNANEKVSTVINGVSFENDSDRIGLNWALTGASEQTGSSHHVQGDSGSLVSNFYYGTPAILTITGLSPGVDYILTNYTRGWGSTGSRYVRITTNVDDRMTVLDQNAIGDGNGCLSRYRYTAPASGVLTVGFDPVDLSSTWHHYAFTNEAASLP